MGIDMEYFANKWEGALPILHNMWPRASSGPEAVAVATAALDLSLQTLPRKGLCELRLNTPLMRLSYRLLLGTV